MEKFETTKGNEPVLEASKTLQGISESLRPDMSKQEFEDLLVSSIPEEVIAKLSKEKIIDAFACLGVFAPDGTFDSQAFRMVVDPSMDGSLTNDLLTILVQSGVLIQEEARFKFKNTQTHTALKAILAQYE